MALVLPVTTCMAATLENPPKICKGKIETIYKVSQEI